MTPEENKAIIAELVGYAMDRHNLQLTSRLLTPEFKRHDMFQLFPVRTGLGGVNDHMSQIFKAIPDLTMNVIEMIAEGDRVVMRYNAKGTHTGELFGKAPTGNTVTWEAINVYRLEDGKVAETWQYMDALGILQKIGAMPTEHM